MLVYNRLAALSPGYWQSIYRDVRWRCALAVGIIALFVTGSFVVIALISKAEDDAAAMINLSGLQRMLSQRIALYAGLNATASDEETKNKARTMLADAIREMNGTHQILYHEDPGSMPRSLQVMLFEEPVLLDQQIHDFIASARSLASQTGEDREPDNAELASLIERRAERMLPALRKAVSIHQEAIETTIHRLYVSALMAGALTIILLAALAIGLFRPLCSRLRLAFAELAEAQEENERQQSVIREMAYRDLLTELPNRAGFQQQMKQAMRQADVTGSWISLLLLDLDEFKHVNDSLGHQIGDELLRQVAVRLQECLRETDHLARLGGDEFVIVVADPGDLSDKKTLGACLIDAIARPFLVHGREIEIGVSIGIACRPRHGPGTVEMLRRADLALYRAKHQGGSVAAAFHDDFDVEIQTRRSMECALRHALPGDQLRIVYQPQFDLASGDVVGVEALLRWRHPDLGDVPPARFIPIAEASGVMTSITDWLLRSVCSQICVWQEEQRGIDAVAINLSPKQLRQPDLDKQIRRICGEFSVSPRQLEIEITESVLAGGDGKEMATIERIKKLGSRLSIDDFGKGYSSLSRLKSFPVGRLKMDRSFVHDITVSAKDEAVSAAIVHLGHSIGVQVIAEGVERLEQAEILARQGCDQVQGFYYCPPLEADQFARFEPKLADEFRESALVMS